LLGVLYVATKARSVKEWAQTAQRFAQDSANSAKRADAIVRTGGQPLPRAPDPSDQRALYQVAADHYFSGNEAVWAYLYYYFVGTSVLALAWGTMYEPYEPNRSVEREVVLATLAIAGVALSLIWWRLLVRSYSYRRPLADAALDFEEAVRNGVGPQGSFRVAYNHSENLKLKGLSWRVGSTRFVVNAVPWLFIAVFLAFFLITVLPHIYRWPATKPNTALHPTAASELLSGRG
jgi:hypothetical protein